jgi:hypothetical protein
VGIGPIGRIGPIRLGGWLRCFSLGSAQHVVRWKRWPRGTEKLDGGRTEDGRAIQAGILRNPGSRLKSEPWRSNYEPLSRLVFVGASTSYVPVSVLWHSHRLMTLATIYNKQGS